MLWSLGVVIEVGHPQLHTRKAAVQTDTNPTPLQLPSER